MYRMILLIVALFPALSVGQEGKPLATPNDWALVPNDALSVLHVKIADVWKNDAMKDVRGILEKAGTKALKTFNERYTPMPSTIERLTAYTLVPQSKNSGASLEQFVCIVTLSTPIERQQFLKQFTAKAVEKKGKLGDYYEDEDGFMAVRFISSTMFAFGTIQGIQHMVNEPLPKKEGPLTPALQLIAGKRPIVIGMNTNFLPQQALNELLDNVPEPLHALFKARCINISADLDGAGQLHAEVLYADKQFADAAEKSLEAGITFAKEQLNNLKAQLEERLFMEDKPAQWNDFAQAAAGLMGLGGLKHLEDLLDKKPIKRNGNTFTASVPLPPHFNTLVCSAAISFSAVVPSISELQHSANRMKSSNNLKQIGLALHNYNDTMGVLPAAAICDKAGKPLLSWRVAILPYVEQENLFRQFKLDEPWDSENNKKLIDKLPPVYAIPGAKKAKPGETHYRVLINNGAAFDLKKGFRIPADFPDGLSNTILVVEAEESVIWTKPEGIEFDPMKDLPKFGTFFKGGFNTLLGDGSVRHISKTVDPKTLKLLIMRNDGEAIPDRK